LFNGLSTLLRYARAHPLGGKHRLATMARILDWQVRCRIASGPIRHKWVNDSVLMVRRHMVGATGNIYFGLHEFPDMGFLLHFLRKGDLFFDIGANVGSYTVLAATVCGVETWSFEPDPDTIADLAANIAANDIGALVTIKPVALGAENGEIAFTIGLDTVNRVADSPDQPQRLVPVTRLDDIAANAAPVMMKIDVEGHEAQVFSAADAVLAKPSLKAIEIESLEPSILEALARHGFAERHYDPFTRRLSETPLNLHANNRLFIRDEAFVADRLKTALPVRVNGQTL
jgi:FkbM family methyltransferase